MARAGLGVGADLEIGGHTRRTAAGNSTRHGHTQTDSYWALGATRLLILDPQAHGWSAMCRPGRDDSGRLADESPRGQRITIMYDKGGQIGQRPTAVLSGNEVGNGAADLVARQQWDSLRTRNANGLVDTVRRDEIGIDWNELGTPSQHGSAPSQG
ncbi:hypothetical protein BDV11DRAFT_166988 [Aspergillus similis]